MHLMHLEVGGGDLTAALVQPLYPCVALGKSLNLLAHALMGTQFMILDLFLPQIYTGRTVVMRAIQ